MSQSKSTIEETAAQIARRIDDLTRANERNFHPNCDTAAIAQALLEHLHDEARASCVSSTTDEREDLRIENDNFCRALADARSEIAEYRQALGDARKSEGEARAELQQLVDSTGLQPGASVADARAQIVRLRYNSECTKGLSKAAADQQFEGGKAAAFKLVAEQVSSVRPGGVLGTDERSVNRALIDLAAKLGQDTITTGERNQITDALGMPPKPWGGTYAVSEIIAEIRRLHRTITQQGNVIADGMNALQDIGVAMGLHDPQKHVAPKIIDQIKAERADYGRQIESAKSVYRHDAQATHRAVADMLGMPAGFIRAAEIGDYIKELKKRASNAEALDQELAKAREDHRAASSARDCHKASAKRAWDRIGSIALSLGLAHSAAEEVVLAKVRQLFDSHPKLGPYKGAAQRELITTILVDKVGSASGILSIPNVAIHALVDAGHGHAHPSLCVCEPFRGMRVPSDAICPVHDVEKWISRCR